MKIHTAWVGPDPIPREFIRNMMSQHGFTTDFNLWTMNPVNYPAYKGRHIIKDEQISWILGTDYWKSCFEAKHYGAACDLLRLVLLWEYGGMWCDGDVELLKNPDAILGRQIIEQIKRGAIDEVDPFAHYALHVGWEDPEDPLVARMIGIAVMVAPPRHFAIGALIEDYKKLTYADIPEGGGKLNGPARFTRRILECREQQPELIRIHPQHVFYPSSWRKPSVVDIRPDTIAHHKWAASWKDTADLSKWRQR